MNLRDDESIQSVTLTTFVFYHPLEIRNLVHVLIGLCQKMSLWTSQDNIHFFTLIQSRTLLITSQFFLAFPDVFSRSLLFFCSQPLISKLPPSSPQSVEQIFRQMRVPESLGKVRLTDMNLQLGSSPITQLQNHEDRICCSENLDKLTRWCQW